jgi:hypothetical protein
MYYISLNIHMSNGESECISQKKLRAESSKLKGEGVNFLAVGRMVLQSRFIRKKTACRINLAMAERSELRMDCLFTLCPMLYAFPNPQSAIRIPKFFSRSSNLQLFLPYAFCPKPYASHPQFVHSSILLCKNPQQNHFQSRTPLPPRYSLYY